MMDPVYTLARLAGIDPDEVDVSGITILQNRLIVYYKTESGAENYVSKKFDL